MRCNADKCTRWWFNSTLLEVIDTSDTSIEVGDFVLVIDSYKKVKDLQDVDHGGWNDNIRGVRNCQSITKSNVSFPILVIQPGLDSNACIFVRNNSHSVPRRI